MARPRRRIAPFACLSFALAAACLPGSRAPHVDPQRTLGLSAGELEARGGQGPFAVVFAGPRGETTDATEATVVFNRPMRALELAGEQGEVPARIVARGAKAPSGAWRWLGTSALVFAPQEALARATEYEVTVPGATRALDGSVLGQDYVFSFRTPAPRLVAMTPSDGATHVKPGQDFALRFDQPVDPREVQRAVRITADGKAGGRIPFTASRPKADVPALVKIVPQRPLPLDSRVEIAVDASLQGLEGPLPAGVEQSRSVRTFGPLAAEISCSNDQPGVCDAHGTLAIKLSNVVDRAALAAHVRIEPPLELRWGRQHETETTDWIALPVDLPPASTFRVTLTAGLADEFGQVLAKDVTKVVSTADELPDVTIGLRGEVLEVAKARGREVPIASVNVPSYTLVTAAASEADVMKLRDTSASRKSGDLFDAARALPGAKVEEIRPRAARNATATRGVPIGAVLSSSKGTGGLVVATSRPNKRWPVTSVHLVSVTDLAITAKVSRFGSLVLVTRLSDGKPVPNATVTVRGERGAELVRAATNASGVATLSPDLFQPVGDHGYLDPGLVLFARSGDDWTWRAVSETASTRDMPSTDLAASMRPFGMLVTDRGIYKPGETIRVKGVFRRPEATGLITPRGHEVMLKAADAEGSTLFEGTAKLGAFGEAAFDVPIPRTAHLGHVSLDAVVDGVAHDAWQPGGASAGVEIAAYRPAEFKVAVEPDKPAHVRGDKASFTIRGDYLFGAPMTSGRVRYNVTRSRASFTPPGLESFSVDDDAYTWALPESSPRGGMLQDGEGVLSEAGSTLASVALALPEQQGAQRVTFEAEVEDLSRQTIASRASVLVHPGEFYVALRRPQDTFLSSGASVKIEAAAVEPDGKRRAGVPIAIELIERSWKTVSEESGDRGVHYESRPVDRVVGACRATTGAGGDLGACELKLGAAGYFIVRGKARDRRGNALASSFEVYVTGTGRVAWPMHDGSSLELVTDKKSYQVGDAARILVKNPYREAEALITVERQGIHEQRRVTLSGPMPTFTVPVTQAMWPNTFVSVELVKGRTAPPRTSGADLGAPAFRIGWAELAVDPEGRRLKVDVRPNKKELRPGEEIDVDLLVTDRAGKGARADVAFYAVDEGVLMLTGYQTPDPIQVFAARRQLSVASVESRDALASIVRQGRGAGVDKGDSGGGGGDAARAREDFRSTAYFQPSVVTGPDGKAHVRFKLPDGLTTYRLMAVAAAEDDRFGFGEERIVTSRPLMARPALPRFLRAGDRIDAGVILTSKGLGDEMVEVKLEASGVVTSGETTKRVKLPAQGSVEVRWPIASPNVGPATFSFTAKARGASDAVKIERNIAVPMTLEAVALYGDTERAVAERLGDLGAMRPDVGGLDVRLSSTALVGLDDGVEALLQYPYGCTEQLTSGMVPLVALEDLAREYGIALPKDPGGAADAAIARILKSQRDDGSFGYWPDATRGDAWVTAYALWGLSLAQGRGRPVPEDATGRATAWLRRALESCGLGEASGLASKKAARAPSRSQVCDHDDVLLASQAFVVDVLASVGKPDAGYTSALFDRRARMPLFARALLAHAMFVSKMRREDVLELVRDVESHLRVTGAGATVAEDVGQKYAALLDSEARTTAIVLRTLVTVEPKHPLAARLAKGLLAARRGGKWRSTQENAWALLALDAYRRAQEAAAPDFEGVAFAGDSELFRVPLRGRSVKAESRTIPAAKLLESPGQTLAFQVEGRGRLFYEARLAYATRELPAASLDRGFFVRKLVRSVKPQALAEALRVLPEHSAREAQASDLVLVDLLVVSPEPREQVVIDDPLPAGLEPVQAKLATTARDLAVTGAGGAGDRADAADAAEDDDGADGRAPRAGWYHREHHDDRVLTFVDHMAAGVHHYRYLARATTPGRFVVPPTKVECMYEPETFGRTAAAVFEVKR